MTDIVERLRSPANVFYEYAADNGAFLREAADEIERLREALRPFACHCDDGTCTEYIKPLVEAKELCECYIARAALGEGKEWIPS